MNQLILFLVIKMLYGVCYAHEPEDHPPAAIPLHSSYREFIDRCPSLHNQIVDHSSFQTFLKNFDPTQPNVLEHADHIQWLQMILKGQEDWSTKKPKDVVIMWSYFADRGVLKTGPHNFPSRLILNAIRQESFFNITDQKRYETPFIQTAAQIHDTSHLVESARFVSHYLKSVYHQGSAHQKKWVTLYPGYISGTFYEQGDIIDDDNIDELITARTYQFDARSQFMQLAHEHDINFSNVESVELEPLMMRVETSDGIHNLDLDVDTYQDLSGILLNYPDFKFEQEVASLDQQNIVTGYVQPMCHMQHSDPGVRWMAINCALDWLLNVHTLNDLLPSPPSSFLKPKHKLALLLMLADQGVIED